MPALTAQAVSATPKARSGAGRRARANTVRRRAGLPAETERSQGLDEEEGWSRRGCDGDSSGGHLYLGLGGNAPRHVNERWH